MDHPLSLLARAFDTKGYPDDKNPENWRTINGAKTHINEEGKIDGGAGGKFTGKQWNSPKHPYNPKGKPQTPPPSPQPPKSTPEEVEAAWGKVVKYKNAINQAKSEATFKKHQANMKNAIDEYKKLLANVQPGSKVKRHDADAMMKYTTKQWGQTIVLKPAPAPAPQPAPQPTPKPGPIQKVSLDQLKAHVNQINQVYNECMNAPGDDEVTERLQKLLIGYKRAQYAAKPADAINAHDAIVDKSIALVKSQLGEDALEDPLLNLGQIKNEPLQKKIDIVNGIQDATRIQSFVATAGLFHTRMGDMPKDYKSAQICARSILKVMGRFPALKGAFNEFNARNFNSPETYAHCYLWSGGRVEVNTQIFNDATKLHRDYARDVKSKYHPAGTDEESVVTHEYGHAINGLLNQKLQKATNKNFDFADYLFYDVCGFKNNTTKAVIKEHLSMYAAQDHAEFMAEAFVEYVHSPKPRPIAMAIGREIERVLTGDVDKNINEILKQTPTFGNKISKHTT